MTRPADAEPPSPSFRAVAQALGIRDTELAAASISTAGFPLEMSALQQLLDLVEAFTDIDDARIRQSCVDFVRDRSSV